MFDFLDELFNPTTYCKECNDNSFGHLMAVNYNRMHSMPDDADPQSGDVR